MTGPQSQQQFARVLDHVEREIGDEIRVPTAKEIGAQGLTDIAGMMKAIGAARRNARRDG